ncbi:MAG: hypothetical protein QF921_02995 [Pseudomonadales bacterium]|nr:hypothetical protein [Pseudomonadales bacterium]MDP6471204.1 hypothetical protein [Pseudomonadales bacterium]MDP6825607.1 hypothetical protein [Pseudomonadales bacterium]MDP6970476.1 hypothetical protein [Pseudomonadales bacterium]
MLNLKAAYAGDAITQDEYEATRRTLLSLNDLCKNTESEVTWFWDR